MRLISYLLILIFWAAVPQESVAQNAQLDCPAHFEPPFQEKEIVVYAAADRKYKMRFRYPKDYEGSFWPRFPWQKDLEETGFIIKFRILDGAPVPKYSLEGISPKYYRHVSLYVEGRNLNGMKGFMNAFRPLTVKRFRPEDFVQPVDFVEIGSGPFDLVQILHRGLSEENIVEIYNGARPPKHHHKIVSETRTEKGLVRVIDSDNDFYIGRENSEIVRYIRCRKPGTVPNPTCQHWVVKGDVDFHMRYNHKYLDQWPTVEKQLNRFWSCALVR